MEESHMGRLNGQIVTENDVLKVNNQSPDLKNGVEFGYLPARE
jgi:hypothetical protein